MPRKAASATRTNTPTRSFTAISPLSSFIDSPRLRLRLALPHSSTRLAFGCGSHCHIHRLASPSAAARTAPFIDSPPLAGPEGLDGAVGRFAAPREPTQPPGTTVHQPAHPNPD